METATLDDSGKLTGIHGSGCRFTVQLDQVAGKNLYTADAQFSGGTGCDSMMSGVAWVSDGDLSGISPT